MTESDAPATVDTPEVPDAKTAFSNLAGWGTAAIASIAGLSSVTYSFGFLLLKGQHRMLGVQDIVLPNPEVVQRALTAPVLSAVTLLYALRTWEGLFLAGVFLVLLLRAEVFGLFSLEDIHSYKWHQVVIRRWLPFSLLVIVSLGALAVGLPVVKQKELLLEPGIGAAIEPAPTAQAGDERLMSSVFNLPLTNLRALRASPVDSRAVYGVLLLAALVCLEIWIALWFRTRAADSRGLVRARSARIVSIAVGCSVALQVCNLAFLYGYLILDTNFPAIRSWSFSPPGLSTPYDASETPADGEQSDATAKPDSEPLTLLILGSSSDGLVIYSPRHRKVYRGVATSSLMPAEQLPEQSPFDDEEVE